MTKKDIELILKKYDTLSLQEKKVANMLYEDYLLNEKTGSYLKYVYYVHNRELLTNHKNLNPKEKKALIWYPGKHCIYICDLVDKLLTDKLISASGEISDILILSIPPQNGKSTMITETLPAFYLGKYPTRKVIEVSYGDSLSKRFGRRNRQKIEEFGEELFGIRLSPTRNTDQEFEVDKHKGSMISRGILAGITGNPADLIVIDDPVKNRSEAESQVRRDKIWDEYLNSIKTRLSAKGKLIVIMTRWHHEDLAAQIAASESGVTVVNIPMEAEDNDILGRKKGESLFPEIGKDTKWMQKFKKVFIKEEGMRSWYALFQGKPTAEEGNLVKNYWWRYWQPNTNNTLPMIKTTNENGEIGYTKAIKLPEDFDEIIQSWDCSFKDTTTSDKVAGVVMARKESNIFILDCVNKQMNIIETIQSIEVFNKLYPKIKRHLIEEKANGAAVIQILSRKMTGIIPIKQAGTSGNTKESRVVAISPPIESGNVYLPHPSLFDWGSELLAQFGTFPLGKFDDIVDAVSQGINDLMYRKLLIGSNVEKGVKGTTSLAYLKMKGYNMMQIRKMVNSGQVKLIEGERL
jgi:predicted phage terminase large subunit-like protein